MLVVDDNKVIRQLIRVNLELEGLEVVTAADGAECLDVVHQVRPDVVTLDVVMPRLDGLKTAARLRADPLTRDTPLAIVSACSRLEVEAGLEAGVDAFLSKPFEPAELVDMVQQLVERARRGRLQAGDGAGVGGDSGAASVIPVRPTASTTPPMPSTPAAPTDPKDSAGSSDAPVPTVDQPLDRPVDQPVMP